MSLLIVKRLVLSAAIATISSSAVAPIAWASSKGYNSLDLLEFRRREKDVRDGLTQSDKDPVEKSSRKPRTDKNAPQPTADKTQKQLSPVERRRQSAEERNQ